jgi:hypothetical protein
VAAFLMLVPMRMAAEGLSAMDAVDAVLADNLHGLEMDARCVEIAVFALALAAWRFPGRERRPAGRARRHARAADRLLRAEGGGQARGLDGPGAGRRTQATAPATFLLRGLDASVPRTAQEKADALRIVDLVEVNQKGQLENPDSRIGLESLSRIPLLENYADSFEGLTTGDAPQFIRKLWELSLPNSLWSFFIGSVDETALYGGRDEILLWENGEGRIAKFPGSFIKGLQAWGKRGFRVTQMRNLCATTYGGELFNKNAGTIVPHPSRR